MKKIAYIGLLFLTACGQSAPNNPQEKEVISKTFLQEVVTAKAVFAPLKKELTLTGKVTADPNKTVSYTPLVSGVIVKSYITLGDRVTKGQTMLDIRSAELSTLQAELIVARRNLQSAEALHEYSLTSERELVEARATYQKVQADLALYGQSKGEGVFSITAPISGYVVEKYGNAGSTISAEGEPLFSIADLSTVWVVANVYAGNLQFVHTGQHAAITSVAYPQEVFQGIINFMAQVFDPEDKALKARIVLPNPELKLKPEMSVVVRLFDESPSKMVAIPSSAVIFDNNGYFVVTGNKEFVIRPIVPFDNYNGLTYISAGLTLDEEVVIKNQLLLYNELKGK